MIGLRPGQLPDSRRWRLLERRTLRRVGRETRIRPYRSRKSLSAPLFLFNCTSFDAKPNYFLAGDVAIVIPSIAKAGYSGAVFCRERLQLNRLQIVRVDLDEPYSFEVAPVRWLADLTYQAWEYRGFAETDSTATQRIDRKSDEILTALGDLGLGDGPYSSPYLNNPPPESDYADEDPDYG